MQTVSSKMFHVILNATVVVTVPECDVPRHVLDGNRLSTPPFVIEPLFDLCEACWHQQPERRPVRAYFELNVT